MMETTDIENVRLGCALESFSDKKEVVDLINNLVCNSQDELSLESAHEKFLTIFDQYQEQPHLLDSALEELLELLIDIIRKHDQLPDLVISQAFKYLYVISKVRSHKILVRHLPHEVSDLEPVLALLSSQDPTNASKWETRYFLLLWLSIIVMIPFNMSRFDNDTTESTGSVKNRLFEIAKIYLCVSDKCRDVAAFFVSKFVSRPDVKQTHLPQFIDWCLQSVMSEKDNSISMNSQAGTLSALSQLFKHGKREDVIDYSDPVLKIIIQSNLHNHTAPSLRKLSYKLIQRLGLTFLKVKIASWRYSRGNRSLAINLKSNQTNDQAASTKIIIENGSKNDIEDEDVPNQLEDVIEILIDGLKDKATVVRWSAAKGIGRITGKLPKDYADQVLESILTLFTLREGDSSWHGGCLALAELGRRGLFGPERLPEVVPVILKALVYDEQKGNFSVGSHIRDAACYVCWSFARAYEPNELQPFVHEIASALLVVSVFDREVNCRRAASAAFQENVGRQGTFPHGIDILTTVDYFAVGNRKFSYLELSKFIAQFEEYQIPLIKHLLTLKVNHWDKEIRELAASALAELTPLRSEYILKDVIPGLLKLSTGFDLFTRHGCIIALGKVVHALATHSENNILPIKKELLESQVIEDIKRIPQILEEKKLYRGMGGELMRLAVCSLIEMISSASIQLSCDATKELWRKFLNENIGSSNIDIQNASLQSIKAFYTCYYISTENGFENKTLQNCIMNDYLDKLESSNSDIQNGFCRLFGILPKLMVVEFKDNVLKKLQICCLNNNKSVELRQYALRSMVEICCNFSTDGATEYFDNEDIRKIFQCLLHGLKDYTIDSRGDVGAWVREESMNGLKVLCELVTAANPHIIPDDMCEAIFVELAKQAVEKIDRVRALAGDVFSFLLYLKPELPFIPYKNEIQEIFPEDDCKNKINWAAPADSFPRFCLLLKFPKFTHSILLGLVVSVGGLTESIIKYSSESLTLHLKTIKNDEVQLKKICDILLSILAENRNISRIIIPFFEMMDQLLSDGLIDPETVGNDFFIDLVDLSKKEIQGCVDPLKLMSLIKLYCTLLQFSFCKKKVLSYLAILMCHRYPRVRQNVASELYESFLTYDVIDEELDTEKILALMGDSDWTESIEKIRPVRDELCELLKIPKPVKRIKKS
ncbi:Tubulin-specific chaperone D [Nymphon striatum]|nr:Tubulin-specific chaperone D [Nymphon striatum]